MTIMALEQMVQLASVACELFLLVFLFCIARFYELKFRESTYYVLFLIPALVFVIAFVLTIFTGFDVEWLSLLTNVSTLLVLMTAGVYLYRKMTGVSR
jgi:hypothetical protein